MSVPSDNRPPREKGFSKDADKLVRRLSLVAFLLCRHGRPATADEIRHRVEGYALMTDEAFKRRFYEDRAELGELGIAIVHQSDETIARDLIVKMGFSGNYLFDPHTRKHVRELWRASLSETGTRDAWAAGGAKSTVDKAKERVREILASEPEHPFPENLGRDFDAIIASAERQDA